MPRSMKKAVLLIQLGGLSNSLGYQKTDNREDNHQCLIRVHGSITYFRPVVPKRG